MSTFPASPAAARYKGTSVADNTEVATVFLVSLRVSHKLFYASVFSLLPLLILEAPLSSSLLFLSWPLLWGQRQTLHEPKFCLLVRPLQSGTKPAGAAHPRPTQKQVHSRNLQCPHMFPSKSLLTFIFNDKTLTAGHDVLDYTKQELWFRTGVSNSNELKATADTDISLRGTLLQINSILETLILFNNTYIAYYNIVQTSTLIFNNITI